MKKIIVGISSLVLLFVAGSLAAASVSWNTLGNDCKTVSIANHETREGFGDPCWPGTTISADPGQSVNVRIYYHNTGTATATNTRVILNAPTINSNTFTHTFTGQVVSDQGSSSSFTVRANLSSSQKLIYSGTNWYTQNQSVTKTPLLYGQDGSEVISGGLSIGSIVPGWATQGSVVVAFRVSNPQPTGTLTASTGSCLIPTGTNSCNINFNWNTQNPIDTSLVKNNSEFIVASGNSGTQPFSVSKGTQVFKLYNNNNVLDTETVSAHCKSGDEWNANTGTCEIIKPTGTLTSNSPSCLIQAGGNSCNVNLNWTTQNPIGISDVTRDGAGVVATGNSGSKTVSIPFTGSTFRLYNATYELDTESVTASCASGSNWNGTNCALPVQDCEINSFTSNKTEVGSGEPAILYWTTNYCNYVNISTVPGDLNANSNKVVNPTNTTTYVLTGYGNTGVTPTRTLTIIAGGPAGAPTFPAGAPTFGA